MGHAVSAKALTAVDREAWGSSKRQSANWDRQETSHAATPCCPPPRVAPDLLAQAHARSTAVGLRAHERPDFAAVAPRAARTARHESRTVLARPPGDGEPSRADRRHAKPRAADRRRRRDPAQHRRRGLHRESQPRRAVYRRVGGAAHAAPTRSAPRSHRRAVSPAFLRANHILTCSCARRSSIRSAARSARSTSAATRAARARIRARADVRATDREPPVREPVRGSVAAALSCARGMRRFAVRRACRLRPRRRADRREPQRAIPARRVVRRTAASGQRRAVRHALRPARAAGARAPGAMFRLTLSTGVRVLARCEFAEAHKTTVAVTPPAPAARVRTPDPTRSRSRRSTRATHAWPPCSNASRRSAGATCRC